MFGISIFSQPEHFIALYLGLFEHKQKGLKQLSNLLARTKNPPISAIYTFQLLQQKSWEQYGLDIIRFLSQLSDLSEGASMSSSLQSVIGESSFLTQIRHNLTHKIKISDYLIQVSRNIIIKELKQKYWQTTFNKYMESYRIQVQKVNQQYERIFNQLLNQNLIQKIKTSSKSITGQWLIKQSNNYEFKQFFPTFCQSNDQIQIINLVSQLQPHKKAIAMCRLIRKFCHDNKNQQLCQLIIKLFRKSPSSLFSEQLILINLKKLAFIHYLGLCSKVLQSLPIEIIAKLSDFWQNKQVLLKQKYPNASIYKKFKKAKIS